MRPLQKLLLAILALLSANYTFSQCPNIVWSDEFNGTSLDQGKWNYQTGTGCDIGICGWGNNELQNYQQANVTVGSGTLKITAKKQRVQSSKYTSGRINTKGKADFTYGRYEALIKLPAGMGLWPAFWMLSTNEPYGGWPQSGEIDIMEFVAAKPNEILGTIHYGNPAPNNQFQGNSYFINGSYTDAYHEFAIEWEPGVIRWLMDGILYSTKTTADVAPYNWPFDQDFHFLLNVAVGGNLGGPVDDAIFPATMEVDYVRVFDGFKPYISGAPVVANQAAGQVYSLGNVAPGAAITWTVPADAVIVSGQGSTQITVDFGAGSGPVSASINDGCSTSQRSMEVEVEPAFVYGFSFENFDAPATATYTFSTGALTEVANPAANAVNASALCGRYVRSASEQYDVLVYSVSNISDAGQYVDKEKKFYVDVYTNAPTGTQILLQLETPSATATNYPTGRHSRYVATITENNNWHRLPFALLDRPDAQAADTDVSSMILLFASNSFTGHTYYLDNLDSYAEDTGGGNIPPTVSITSPVNGASFTTGTQAAISANATDADGTVSQVEFFVDGNSIGIDNSSPYSVNWTVSLGSHSLTAVATDNLNAGTTSAAITVSGQSAGPATHVLVADVVTGTVAAGQGKKRGTATVSVVDNLGNPVNGATVSGEFSGTFSQSVSGVTNAQGQVSFQTTASAKGTLVVNFCVSNVAASPLIYDPAQNGFACSAPRLSGVGIAGTGSVQLTVFPNPVRNRLKWQVNNLPDTAQVHILDQSGKVLLSAPAQAQEMNIHTLAPGTYYLQASDGAQTIQTRFVKAE